MTCTKRVAINTISAGQNEERTRCCRNANTLESSGRSHVWLFERAPSAPRRDCAGLCARFKRRCFASSSTGDTSRCVPGGQRPLELSPRANVIIYVCCTHLWAQVAIGTTRIRGGRKRGRQSVRSAVRCKNDVVGSMGTHWHSCRCGHKSAVYSVTGRSEWRYV